MYDKGTQTRTIMGGGGFFFFFFFFPEHITSYIKNKKKAHLGPGNNELKKNQIKCVFDFNTVKKLHLLKTKKARPPPYLLFINQYISTYD